MHIAIFANPQPFSAFVWRATVKSGRARTVWSRFWENADERSE
jgi:hypothetical protein